jgi:bifunctional DNA-binding transcriptional regulator/antitoxin component of YhaV-PrlF toxin-antitoxin module
MGVQGHVYGPRTITKVYQVSVPAALLRQVGLDKHSEVAFAVSLEDPAMICMFAAERTDVRALPGHHGPAPSSVTSR